MSATNRVSTLILERKSESKADVTPNDHSEPDDHSEIDKSEVNPAIRTFNDLLFKWGDDKAIDTLKVFAKNIAPTLGYDEETRNQIAFGGKEREIDCTDGNPMAVAIMNQQWDFVDVVYDWLLESMNNESDEIYTPSAMHQKVISEVCLYIDASYLQDYVTQYKVQVNLSEDVLKKLLENFESDKILWILSQKSQTIRENFWDLIIDSIQPGVQGIESFCEELYQNPTLRDLLEKNKDQLLDTVIDRNVYDRSPPHDDIADFLFEKGAKVIRRSFAALASYGTFQEYKAYHDELVAENKDYFAVESKLGDRSKSGPAYLATNYNYRKSALKILTFIEANQPKFIDRTFLTLFFDQIWNTQYTQKKWPVINSLVNKLVSYWFAAGLPKEHLSIHALRYFKAQPKLTHRSATPDNPLPILWDHTFTTQRFEQYFEIMIKPLLDSTLLRQMVLPKIFQELDCIKCDDKVIAYVKKILLYAAEKADYNFEECLILFLKPSANNELQDKLLELFTSESILKSHLKPEWLEKILNNMHQRPCNSDEQIKLYGHLGKLGFDLKSFRSSSGVSLIYAQFFIDHKKAVALAVDARQTCMESSLVVIQFLIRVIGIDPTVSFKHNSGEWNIMTLLAECIWQARSKGSATYLQSYENYFLENYPEQMQAARKIIARSKLQKVEEFKRLQSVHDNKHHEACLTSAKRLIDHYFPMALTPADMTARANEMMLLQEGFLKILTMGLTVFARLYYTAKIIGLTSDEQKRFAGLSGESLKQAVKLQYQQYFVDHWSKEQEKIEIDQMMVIFELQQAAKEKGIDVGVSQQATVNHMVNLFYTTLTSASDRPEVGFQPFWTVNAFVALRWWQTILPTIKDHFENGFYFYELMAVAIKIFEDRTYKPIEKRPQTVNGFIALLANLLRDGSVDESGNLLTKEDKSSCAYGSTDQIIVLFKDHPLVKLPRVTRHNLQNTIIKFYINKFTQASAEEQKLFIDAFASKEQVVAAAFWEKHIAEFYAEYQQDIDSGAISKEDVDSYLIGIGPFPLHLFEDDVIISGYRKKLSPADGKNEKKESKEIEEKTIPLTAGLPFAFHQPVPISLPTQQPHRAEEKRR